MSASHWSVPEEWPVFVDREGCEWAETPYRDQGQPVMLPFSGAERAKARRADVEFAWGPLRTVAENARRAEIRAEVIRETGADLLRRRAGGAAAGRDSETVSWLIAEAREHRSTGGRQTDTHQGGPARCTCARSWGLHSGVRAVHPWPRTGLGRRRAGSAPHLRRSRQAAGQRDPRPPRPGRHPRQCGGVGPGDGDPRPPRWPAAGRGDRHPSPSAGRGRGRCSMTTLAELAARSTNPQAWRVAHLIGRYADPGADTDTQLSRYLDRGECAAVGGYLHGLAAARREWEAAQDRQEWVRRFDRIEKARRERVRRPARKGGA